MSTHDARYPQTERNASMNWRCFLALMLLTAAGCSQRLPPVADPVQAREALTIALDAWRNGDSAESLRSRPSAIYFNEPQCDGNTRLIEYRIETEQASGQSWFCDVVLTLELEGGRKVERLAGYCIDTDPAIVIVRQT